MADLSEDEDSPHSEQNMSYIGFCNTMDEVEQALLVGQQLAAVASSSNQPTCGPRQWILQVQTLHGAAPSKLRDRSPHRVLHSSHLF